MGDGDESKKQLGKIMLQRRLVTADELQEILDDQAKHPGSRLASTAARRGRVTMLDALRALSEQMGAPGIDLTEQVVPLNLLKLIPQELAHEHVVFPLRIDAESIYLAMASPDSEATVEELEFVTGKKVKVHVALDYVIREVIDYSYAAQEDGDEFYVGAHVTDAALAELGLSDLKRAPEPNIERQSDPGGEETEDAALAESPVTDDELFPNDETRTVSEAPPLDDAFAQKPTPSQPPVMPPPEAGASVLIADRSTEARTLLRSALQETGIAVLEADDGVRALELVRDQSPRVLVLEAELPQVHGFDICRRLKGSQRFSDIPVVVVSSEPMDWRIENDLREVYGVRHVFQKPFDRIKITRTIRLLLDGQEQPEELPALSAEAESAWNGAMSAFEAGDLDGAIQQLEEGAEREPEAFELHYHLGLLYGRRDELFRAITALTSAVALEPRHFSALKNLAVVFQRAGFRRKALDIWQRAMGCAPDEDTRLNIREHMVSLL